MHGLEVRCQLAMALVVATFDEDLAETIFGEACQSAYAEGVRDFHCGAEIPAMYKDQKILAGYWQEGWEFSTVLKSTKDCASCQTGDPCPTHQ